MWRYFSYAADPKLACSCCGKQGMDGMFMQMLDGLRGHVGIPFRITSGYRCPKYNAAVSSTGKTGPHTTGRAVDIACTGGDALRIVEEAIRRGFSGIGIHQHGPHESRFVHLDTLLNGPGQPRPWLWTY